MNKISRRELLQQAGILTATSLLASPIPGRGLTTAAPGGGANETAYAWIPSARIVIAEGYNSPFYPTFEYEPEKALAIVRQLNGDAIRYPTASYYAYFPTKTKYPIHPGLGTRDPLRRTVELFHEAGLKVVAYNPLNHPFMDVQTKDPDYEDWMRRDAEGRPITTTHMGWNELCEGCLNSPLRDVIKARVREVLIHYPVDVMYFDGPYQGFDSQRFCHCRYCEAAYERATGKTIPLQNGTTTLEDEIAYRRWMSEDVVVGFLREIREMIRQTRDVPVLYNNTDLLNKGEWRSRGFLSVDGFMFEAADTPEQKLFNMQLGQSTGKVIWTYLGSYAECNGEHMIDRSVLGWYSYPGGGQSLLLDGAVATATGAGFCYWGLQRFFYVPESQAYESGRFVKEVFDFRHRHEALIRSAKPVPQAGILVGSQTINWFQGQKFVLKGYRNYYQGAYQLLKSLSYDSEPFLDYEMTAEKLAKYKLLFVPNAPCLSDAQCATITNYVEDGGALVATHLTSAADEYGRPRSNYGLAELFGVNWKTPTPVEVPDLLLRTLSSDSLIPQDPQVVLFESANQAEVIGETYDRGHHRTLGPAVVARRRGKGRVIYIGSGLEAIYEETLMEPIRAYFASLLDPILGEFRTYEVEFRLGLMPHLVAAQDALLLHLLADTGNIWNQPLARAQFLPVTDIKVRVRVPQGRQVKSVSLLRAEQSPKWAIRDGWVELTVPRVLIHEAVRVDLT